MFQKLRRRIFFCTTWCLLVNLPVLNGQIYSFKNWGGESRLPDTYIYSISQDNNGFLWIGTGSGLVKFDGFDFHEVVFPDSINGRFVSATAKDKNGRLWLGCNDGSVFYTYGDELVKIVEAGIQGINQIFESADGFIYVVPQDKMLLKIPAEDPGKIKKLFVRRNISMTAACFTGENNLLLGTQENLLYCSISGDSVIIDQVVKGIDYTKVQSIVPAGDNGIYLIGTEGSGLFKLKLTGTAPEISRFRDQPDFESLDIKAIVRDNRDNLLIPTYGSGLIELKLSPDSEEILSWKSYNASNGLQGDNIRTVFQDMEENIWIGHYGEGISMMGSQAFTFYTPSDNPEENNIIYIAGEGNFYFLGTPAGYIIFDPATARIVQKADLSRQIGGNEIISFLKDGNSLWIGTRGNGLFLKRGNGYPVLLYQSGNTGEDYIKNITASASYLWLSTLNGVIILDKKTGTKVRSYKIEDHLPHNSISQVFITDGEKGIVATESDRIYTIDPREGVTIGSAIMSGITKNKVLCLTGTSGGKLFAGTSGNGIFYFSGDSVFNISSADGLFSNYCYSILADRDDKVWVGHERGFSRYNPVKGSLKVFTTEFAKGGDCNPNAIIQTTDGMVLIGTTEGLIVYDKSHEISKRKAPVNNIVSVTINNRKYPPGKNFTLPYDKYVIKIDYVGINLSDPGKVFYMTRMDNFDDEWTEMKSTRQATYSLRDGRYRFNLFSANDEGLSDEEELSFDIYIKKPFWRTSWFISLMVLTAASIIVLIVREREKAQKKIKEYLESELAERTRLVMKQKDEIELQNIEITDSINYAKRIQSSILPDMNKLKDTFNDAFIIFHPRDIVSGDFYWFDKIDQEKFIIVCADSTGHGVPGAFMSMIGSALLQDIISRKGITRPSTVLGMLDKQIFSTLNQNVDVGVSNDGMDMVVCEINTRTRLVRFASAMRPVIIVMGGESYYIKGNRCSVGGEAVIEKFFDDQEYYLSQGDTIYMFSDGLPDQFGGSDGKKMKIARLKKLIEDICNQPMNEQKQIITDFYFDWKGDYEQVDDILLMGIRV